MTPATLRLWRATHRWTSLLCAINLLILCVTGLILVFHHEIDHLLGGEDLNTSVMEGQARLPLQTLADIADAKDADRVPRFLSFDAETPGAVFVYLDDAASRDFEDGRWVLLNAHTGENEVLGDPTDSFVGVILTIHMDLFAGFAGQMAVGVMGLLFVVSAVSGLVVYGPFMKKLAFGLLRFARGTRIAHIDLHNLFGAATLVWAVVVGVTGAILAFSPLILGYWQATELAALTARHGDAPVSGPMVDLDRVAAAGRETFPDMELAFIAYPAHAYSTDRHFSVVVRGRTEVTQRVLSAALVDAGTGAVVETVGMPWYITALLLSGPFHFGDYGGLPLQILWALFTLATGAVTVTGVVVWIKRPRGREAPAGDAAATGEGAA